MRDHHSVSWFWLGAGDSGGAGWAGVRTGVVCHNGVASAGGISECGAVATPRYFAAEGDVPFGTGCSRLGAKSDAPTQAGMKEALLWLMSMQLNHVRLKFWQ